MFGDAGDAERWARPVRVAAEAPRCVRAAFPRSPCDRCVRACPAGAITLDRGARVGEGCTGCGACVAACPHGVFTSPHGDEEDLGAALAQAARKGVARVTCVRTAASSRGAVVLPCAGRMSAEALVAASSRGVRRVEVCTADCARCDQRAALTLLPEAVDLAWSLCVLSGRALEFAHLLGGEGPIVPVGGSRRGLVQALLWAPQAATASLQATTSGEAPRSPQEARRARFLEAITVAPEPSSGASVQSAYWPFGRVTLDPEACTGCPVCASVCSVGALRREVGRGMVVLTVDPKRCTGCEACEAACREGAVEVRAALPEELTKPAAPGLVAIRGRTCPRCQQFTRAPSGQPCAACRHAGGRLRGLAPSVPHRTDAGGTPR